MNPASFLTIAMDVLDTPQGWDSLIHVGGPAVAILVTLTCCLIAVWRYAGSPAMDKGIESLRLLNDSSNNCRDAAEACKEAMIVAKDTSRNAQHATEQAAMVMEILKGNAGSGG